MAFSVVTSMPSRVSCRLSMDPFHRAEETMVWPAMHTSRATEGTARRHSDMFLWYLVVVGISNVE